MEKGKEGLKKDRLRELIRNIESLSKKGVINSLSIQQSGINDRDNYMRVSFKIPWK